MNAELKNGVLTLTTGGISLIRVMARPLRVPLAGGVYHVTARGDERKAIVRDGDTDRARFLDTLASLMAHDQVACHAWVVMTNHYHLLLETPEGRCEVGSVSLLSWDAEALLDHVDPLLQVLDALVKLMIRELQQRPRLAGLVLNLQL